MTQSGVTPHLSAPGNRSANSLVRVPVIEYLEEDNVNQTATLETTQLRPEVSSLD
jgi:hypothetical protein